MISEPKNIPLKGLFPLPDELADAPTQARVVFWRLIGTEALRLKRQEILSGIDRWGNKFQPVKRKWGDPTPLLPHGKASRTYRLLSLNSSAQGATLYWKSDGGRETWPTILGYHAYKHGPRSLPVRDELGLTQKSIGQLMAQADIWKAGYEAGLEWASKHSKELKLGKPRIPPPERFPGSRAAYERELVRRLGEKPKVVLPVSEPKPRPKPKPKPRPAAEDLKLTKAEDKRRMQEADRLAKEAADESQKIMDEARLSAIRAKEAKKKPKQQGNKLVDAIADSGKTATKLFSELEEKRKRITELMWAQAGASPEELKRIRAESDRLIDEGKALRKRALAAREIALDAVVKHVDIPVSQQSKLKVDLSSYEQVTSKEEMEIAHKAIERLGAMTRNAPIKVSVVPLDPGERSYYDPKTGNLHLTPGEPMETVAHEVAHKIEADHPEINKACVEFLKRRVGNEAFTDLTTIPGGSALTGETGRKDKFDQFYDDPNKLSDAYYVGKVYPGGDNELLSMGVQALFTDPGKFAAKDPEWCKFILDVLSGKLRSK